MTPECYFNVRLEATVCNLAVNSMLHSVAVNTLDSGNGGTTAFDSRLRTVNANNQDEGQCDLTLGKSYDVDDQNFLTNPRQSRHCCDVVYRPFIAMDQHCELTGSTIVLPACSNDKYSVFAPARPTTLIAILITPLRHLEHQVFASGRAPWLRGCIDNFEPMPIRDGIVEYALISAFKNSWFRWIEAEELPSLECWCVPVPLWGPSFAGPGRHEF